MTRLIDILKMRSKSADAVLSMCHLYNDTDNSVVRKSLIAGMKTITSAMPMKNYLGKLDINKPIDISEAETVVDSISALRISPAEQEEAYKKYIDENMNISVPFSVKGTTKANVAFYIRYGISMNNTYMENHFDLVSSKLNGPALQLFNEQLLKAYVAPKIKDFVAKNCPQATVKDARPLDGRNLLTVDVLIPIFVDNCTDDAVLDATKFIKSLIKYFDNLF